MSVSISLITWLVIVALGVTATGALARRLGAVAGVPLAIAVVGLLGAEWQRVSAIATRLTSETLARSHAPIERVPQGFSGSGSCRGCHPDEYRSWAASYHRTMTQRPSGTAVMGDFTAGPLILDGVSYRLSRDADQFAINGDAVTLVTGSHHMQTYWLGGDAGNAQRQFPFTYLREDRRWVPRSSVFLYPAAQPLQMQVWNTNCILCHVTDGQPRQYGGSAGFDSRVVELGIACEACHGPGGSHAAANHDPRRRYALHGGDAADPTIFNPGRAEHVASSEACGRCHAIRRFADREAWNRDGITFRPGGDLEAAYPSVSPARDALDAPGNEKLRMLVLGSFWPDGMVRVSGREFTALRASSCFQRGTIACVDCHSMHNYADTDDQLRPDRLGDDSCTSCHPALATAAARAAHSHHDANAPGSRCESCHMPHTTYGLLKAIRSHQISSPSVRESIDAGRPNACSLCHLDRPLSWVAERLATWYGQPMPSLSSRDQTVAAGVAWVLGGDAGQRAVVAWHLGDPDTRAASGSAWMVPYLAELLDDPYAAVRYIAQRSLRRYAGFEDLAFDYVATPDPHAGAGATVRAAWSASTPLPPAVLLTPTGIDRAAATHAGLVRDDHPMELLE